MKNLEEKVTNIINNSDFNNLPFEERKRISKYMSEIQILTLWQVLTSERFKDFRCPRFNSHIRGWLENCVRDYQKE